MRHFVFFLLLHLFPTQGWAGTPAPDVNHAYFYDEHDVLSFDEIEAATFTPYKGDLKLGFSKGTAWVRLDITPSELPSTLSIGNTNSPLILRAGPYYLDEITLVEKIDGKWSITTAGDLHEKLTKNCVDDFHCFVLQGSPQEPHTIYLKIKTTGLLTLESEVLPVDLLASSSINRVKQISISLTLACALLVFGLIFYFRYRSSMLHIFCWFQVAIILFISARTGILGQLLPGMRADILDKFGHIFFICRVYLHGVLGREFIAPYQLNSIYKKLIAVVSIICAVNILIVLLDFINFALILTTSIFLLIPLIQIYGIISTPNMSKKLRPILLVSYSFFFLMVGAGWMMSSGLISPGQDLLTLRGIADMRLNGIITSFFVFWIILVELNIREKAKAKDIIKLRLDAAQSQANQEKLMDRNTLIDMLTHELKNPLGTIKFAATSVKRKLINDAESLQRFKHIDLCITRMNKLIEHVARSSKIDRLHELGPVESIPAAAMIHDLIEEYTDNKEFILNIEEGIFFHANREMLTVIFENLISNANKYADPKNPISISIASASELTTDTADTQDSICFKISNTAGVHGAPDENRLFERYYRHSYAQSVSGLGIGLSLVKAAAQKIGATVHYQFVDDQITFIVRIPN